MIKLWLGANRIKAVLLAFTAGALLAANLLGGKTLPVGVYGLGIVGGVAIALHTAGLVVVYKANRVINFAQVQMSVLGGLLFASLVQRRLPLVALHKVCPPCLPAPRTVGDLTNQGDRARDVLEAMGLFGSPAKTPLSEAAGVLGGTVDRSVLAASVAPGPLVQISFWLSLVVSVAVVVFLVWTIHALFVKRFNDAPRLVLTVATLGAGEFALTAGRRMLAPLLSVGTGEPPVAGPVPPPINLRFDVSPTVFGSADVMVVAVGVALLVGLAWFFKRSGAGVAMRAAAENPERARTLGVDVNAVTSRAWVLAGLLGGTAAVLSTARVGTGSLESFGTLTTALVAAVAGGLATVPLAVAGAFAVSLINQAALWTWGTPAVVDIAVLLLVATLLSVRTGRASRAERDSNSSWRASVEIRPIPAELVRHPAVRRGLIGVSVLVGALVLGYPWFMSSAQISLGQSTMVTAMIGLSLLVLTGWAGQISLGQIGFAAIGAWVISSTGLPFLAALPVAAVIGAGCAVAVGIPAIRLRGLYLAIASLTFGAAASAVLLDGDLLGGNLKAVPRPIVLGIDFNDDRSFYYLALVFLVATVVGVSGLRRSRVGRALIATRDNELAAEAYGISIFRARLTGFAVSGFVAAVAGVLLAVAQGGVEARSFGGSNSVAVFLTTIVGGVGSISGPVLGAVFFGLLRLMRTTPLSFIVDLLQSGGLLVVAVLLFLPGGISGAVFSVRDSWLRRVAARDRIVVPSLIADTGRLGATTLPIAPPKGVAARYVPVRYRLDDQWSADPAPVGGEVR